jgi:cellulose synthase/poly-beta-1,6-N-acetylglucosamine synthase-like glycosyltransferase
VPLDGVSDGLVAMAVLGVLWYPAVVLYCLILIVFFLVGLNLLYMVAVAARRPPRHLPLPPHEVEPCVTIQLPIYNEFYVVDRLISAACALDWPRDRFEIQVLDDSTDETQFRAARLVQRFREAGLNIHYLHRAQRIGYKAGALEAGLHVASGEFIAIFDADFIPPPDFLRNTISYFRYDRVGFVQTRWGHLNQTYSILTQLQSVVIDAHFLVDQVARNRGGYFMNFNGTAGVWRRQTIVEAGGWEHDTVAEDLDLSYRAQLLGWEAVYLPDVVTEAELPITISGYRSQQRRWAAGGFACAIKLLPRVMRAPLSIGVKFQAALHLLGYGSHVCLLLLLAMHPLLLALGIIETVSRSTHTPFLLPLTLVPAIAPWVYLCYAQRQATGRWLRRAPQILGASVLGAAIMTSTTTAMMRVLASKKDQVFERTPKYGIAGASEAWDGKRYGPGSDPAFGLELLIACYSVSGLVYAASSRNWASMFFTAYMLTGLFLYIVLSLAHMNASLLPRALASSTSGPRE